MPYIDKQSRIAMDEGLRPITAGELNYVLTKVVNQYIEDNGSASYSVLNAVIGVLECAKQELYRRVLVPYEDKKRAENGDVYDVR